MVTGSQGNILVVVHGPGRGRDVPTGPAFMARLRRHAPDLAARIVTHETGNLAPSFAGIGLVVFWLGDPLRQKYPACYAEAEAMAQVAARRGIPVLNHPDGLSNTTKALQSDIWLKAGIPCAPVRCVSDAVELFAACAEFDSPCFLRGNDTHAERSIRTLSTPAQIDAAARSLAGPAAVVRIHDVRAEYRAAGTPGSSLYSRFHHKARAFVCCGDVKASHLFFSRQTAVGLSNSLFSRESGPIRSLARAAGFRRQLFDDLVSEDIAYFHSSLPYKDVLVNAVTALGLDIAAVDYSIRPDGTPILWEANPYFCLPPGSESILSEERLAVGRVNASLDWIAASLGAAIPERLAS